MSKRLVFAIVFLSSLVVAATAAFAITASPGEILTNPGRYDGQPVALRGQITNLRERISRAGNAYYTFDLSDNGRSIRVFSFGSPPCRSGVVTVDGTFSKVKHQGRYTFYNEIEATSVACGRQ